jgi:CRP-like cAMP-binding protein|mmetsp:Transcript_67404/g.113095  ORF Transcript_67404/g.113095 Transcript_67404/m.113095 type:complete len:865 (+) Transcript_67404:130-2724(+)
MAAMEPFDEEELDLATQNIPVAHVLTMRHILAQLPKGQAQAQSQSVQRAKTGTGNGEFVRTFGLTEVDVKSAWQKKTRFRSATPDPVASKTYAIPPRGTATPTPQITWNPPGADKKNAKGPPLPGEKPRPEHGSVFIGAHDTVKRAHQCARESERRMRQAERRLEELHGLVHLAAMYAAPRRRQDMMKPRSDSSEDALAGARRRYEPENTVRLPRLMHTTASMAMQAPLQDDLQSIEEVSPDVRPRLPRKIQLSQANSVMLQMGLKFELPKLNPRQWIADVRGEEDGPSYATTPQSLGMFLREAGWQGPPRMREGDLTDSDDDSEDEEEELMQDRHLAAKMRRAEAREAKLYRLRDKIEKRDQLRALAMQMTKDKPRMLVNGLRSAMWLTVVQLIAHCFWDAPQQQRLTKIIERCVLPLWRRHRAKKERKAARMFLNAFGRRKVVRPSAAELRSTGPLFSKWPDTNLQSFLRKLYLMVFRPGEVICHSGDVSDVLYILVKGTVDVIAWRASSTGKGRGRKSGVVVAAVNPTRYVGEYGVFADEPRAATLVAQTQVFCWVSSKEAFRFELNRLPKVARTDITKSLEANMTKIYKVRPVLLASTPLFLNWDLKVLEDLVTKLEPFVFAEKQVMVKQGDLGTCLFIIARGKCESVIRTGTEEHRTFLTSGEQLGQRGCLFVEPQHATVRTVTTVQAWRLQKSVLMDYMLQRPDWFLAAKQRLNRELEKSLPKPSIQHIMNCGLFPQELSQRLGERIYETCLQPRVVEGTAPLIMVGEEFRGLYLIIGGTCTFEGKQYGAGDTLGMEQVNRHEAFWRESVLANTRLDVWFLNLNTLHGIMQKPGKLGLNNPQVLKLQQVLNEWKENAR